MDAQRQIELRILIQHRIIAERLQANPEAVLGHARANLARWAKNYREGPLPGWMREWQALLAGPRERVLEVLTGEDEESIRLRSSSPFAGVVSPEERAALIKRVRDATA